MASQTRDHSATILAFPKRGRIGIRKHLIDTSDILAALMPKVDVLSASGWYHDAAIREAAMPRRRHLNPV